MLKKEEGFTLIEMIITVSLFAVLMTSLMSIIILSSGIMKDMETTIGRKSQYQRSVSFISNTIKRNQKEDAVTIYGSKNERVVVALSDDPGKYLHYFIYNDELLMYVGREKDILPAITDSDKYQKTMTLAKNIKNIRFDFDSNSDMSRRYLKVTYIAKNKNGTEESHIDKINIYVD